MNASAPNFLGLILPLTAAAALLTACSPGKGPEAQDDHAGHNHGPTAKATPESHSTHQAGAGSHPGEIAAGTLMCDEHGLPESACGICNPQLVSGLEPGGGVKVRLPSMDSARMAGIKVAHPGTGPMADGVECLAELGFNLNRLAQLAAPVGGTVQSVEVDLGSKIEEKQIVARIWSAAIAEAVARAVLTHQTLDRERRLRVDRITSEKDLQQAEAEHRAACQQARTLGFSEEQIDVFGSTPTEPVLLEVRAPFAGEIVERNAVLGARVEPGRSLFTLADRSTMWAMLNIPETALGRVEVGQTVELRVDSLPRRIFTGRLTWIGAEVDERTRLARARVEVPNPDSVLKSRMFARARILTRVTETASLLPASALQQVLGKPIVFVQLADDLFEARAVTVGARRDDVFEVLAGVRPDDAVVVSSGFALKSQLLASRLGAGCAHE